MSIAPAAAGGGGSTGGPFGLPNEHEDPRTNLELIDVPQDHQRYFSDLNDALIHWFGVVDKYNRMWKPQRRVAIFTDQCIYLTRMDGGITRCVNIRWIQEMIVTEQHAIGFRVGPPDYDMLISVTSIKEKEDIIRIVGRVYWSLAGTEIRCTRLSGNSGEAMQQMMSLTKPKEWTLKIEPMKSRKALAKLWHDKLVKEQDDRRVVEEEFARIKEGLRLEVQKYRTEEFERAVDQLSQYVKALEDKDREIAHLKESTVRLDDPEVWRKCPNCVSLRKVLDSSTNDDKQRIIRLERDLEAQRHIVEHLQAAIQYRSSAVRGGAGGGGPGGGGGGEGGADGSVVSALRMEIADANRRNKELQQLILSSPFLTSDVKQRAAQIAQHREGAIATASFTTADWSEALGEKDREIRHLKSVLRDATARHVQELETIRQQFQRYDAEMVQYVERALATGSVGSLDSGTPAMRAEATVKMARQAALTTTAGGAAPAAIGFAPSGADRSGYGGYGGGSPAAASSYYPSPAPGGSSMGRGPSYATAGGNPLFALDVRPEGRSTSGAAGGWGATPSPLRGGAGDGW